MCGVLLVGVVALGCRETVDVPDPRLTVSKLLAVHGVLGKDADQRTSGDRKKRIGTADLKALFVDYDNFDPFLADLYVGFVVGALARFQDRLVVNRTLNRTVITAGKATVVMQLDDNGWRILLGRSVPEAIKARAKLEMARMAERLARQH